MKINLPVKYSQMDPSWSHDLLGFNTDPKFNLFNYGCLVTCLAMVACYYGKEETPRTMNERVADVNGFVGYGLYVYGSVSRIYRDIAEHAKFTPHSLTNDELNLIRSQLDDGHPVIVQIDYNPMTVTYDTHYVVIVDYDPRNENNFTIVDPLGGKTRSLQDYLRASKPTARIAINQIITYAGPKPALQIEGVNDPMTKAERRLVLAKTMESSYEVVQSKDGLKDTYQLFKTPADLQNDLNYFESELDKPDSTLTVYDFVSSIIRDSRNKRALEASEACKVEVLKQREAAVDEYKATYGTSNSNPKEEGDRLPPQEATPNGGGTTLPEDAGRDGGSLDPLPDLGSSQPHPSGDGLGSLTPEASTGLLKAMLYLKSLLERVIHG